MRPIESARWPDEPGWLTASAAKTRTYRDDIWARESWRDAVLTSTNCEQLLCRYTYLLVKPESFATRQAGRLMSEVRRRGFSTLGAVPVTLDRRSLRILWQYQLNSAPIATLAAVDLIVMSGPAVVVILRDENPDLVGRATASSRLAAMKGSTHGPRRPDDFRVLLGGTLPLFSFLHVPDEPADLVREWGIWFSRETRLRLYSQLSTDIDAKIAGQVFNDADLVIQQRESATDHADLDADRVLATLLAGPAQHQAAAEKIRAVLAESRPAGVDLPGTHGVETTDDELVDLVRLVRKLDGIATWDRVTLAVAVVGRQRPIGPPLL